MHLFHMAVDTVHLKSRQFGLLVGTEHFELDLSVLAVEIDVVADTDNQ